VDSLFIILPLFTVSTLYVHIHYTLQYAMQYACTFVFTSKTILVLFAVPYTVLPPTKTARYGSEKHIFQF
jgi:ABC-type sulfate transport system permease subunit